MRMNFLLRNNYIALMFRWFVHRNIFHFYILCWSNYVYRNLFFYRLYFCLRKISFLFLLLNRLLTFDLGPSSYLFMRISLDVAPRNSSTSITLILLLLLILDCLSSNSTNKFHILCHHSLSSSMNSSEIAIL